MQKRTAYLIVLAVAILIGGCGPAEVVSPTPINLSTRIPTATFATFAPTLSPTPYVLYTLTPTIEPPPTHTPTLTPEPSLTPTITNTPGPGGLPTTLCKGTILGASLLANGGFEGGQHNQEFSEIRVPDAWAAFWQKEGAATPHDPQNGSGYQRPETWVINGQPPYDNPPRVGEGFQAFRMMGNERAFDAGLWQQVTVTSGAVYCLTGSSHAWSSHTGTNPFQSSLDTADDQRNANFLLGIDPTGGTDPWSGAIRWSQAARNYDSYQPMYTVQVTAQSSTITVFVRGFMLWRLEHNEMFFDGISLYPIG